jgi:hypothetical protein
MTTFDNVIGGDIASVPGNGELLGCMVLEPGDDIPADINAKVKRSNTTSLEGSAAAGAALSQQSASSNATTNVQNPANAPANPQPQVPGGISLRKGAKFVFGGVEVLVKSVSLRNYANPLVSLLARKMKRMHSADRL